MLDIPLLSIEKVSYLEKLTQLLESPNSLDIPLLLENVFEELSSCYLSALITRKSSFSLEKLISYADHSWVVRFTLDLVGVSWKRLLFDPHSSHVFDTALKKLSIARVGDERIKDLVFWFSQDNTAINKYLESPYASKSLKHLIDFLNSQTQYKKLKIRFRHFIVQNVDLIEIAKLPHGSSFLQHLLIDSYYDNDETHRNTDSNDIKQMINSHSKKWLQEGGSIEFRVMFNIIAQEDIFHMAIRDMSISRLIEVLLTLAPDNFLQELIEKFFKNHLKEFISDSIANFVIQRVIEISKNEEQLTWIIDELMPSMDNLFSGRAGILLKLVQAASKYQRLQIIITDIIINILSDEKSQRSIKKTRENLSYLLLTKKNQAEKKVYTSKTSNSEFSYFGCQILSELLNFRSPWPEIVASSFLKIEPEILIKASKDPLISRTVEKLITFQGIPEYLRRKLVIILIKSDICSLCSDKNGSHVTEKCFDQARLKTKIKLLEKLVDSEKELLNSFYARHVLRFCRITQFKHKFQEWMTEELRKQKAKDEFEEILNFNEKRSTQKIHISKNLLLKLQRLKNLKVRRKNYIRNPILKKYKGLI